VLEVQAVVVLVAMLRLLLAFQERLILVEEAAVLVGM
jgi:hypothetical protein